MIKCKGTVYQTNKGYAKGSVILWYSKVSLLSACLCNVVAKRDVLKRTQGFRKHRDRCLLILGVIPSGVLAANAGGGWVADGGGNGGVAHIAVTFSWGH